MNAPNEAISPLALHLTFAAGKGVATLRERRLGPAEVERLDLEIPKLVFPFDISGGTARFQSRRCIVRAATFSVSEDIFVGWLASSFPGSALSLKAREGYLSLSGKFAWRAGDSIDLTARVFVDISHGRSAFVLLDDLRLYGVPPAPAPLLSLALLRSLRPTVPDSLQLVGTSAAEVEPLRVLVTTQLPPLGWKIPDVREVRLEEVTVEGGKVRFSYGPADAISQPPSPTRETLRAREALRLFSAAEELLIQGKPQEALLRLRRDAERVGEHPFLDLRIGELLAADPERDKIAQAHLEGALDRHEGSSIEPRLHALLAQLFLRQRDPAAARPHLEALADASAASSNPDEALFAGHWLARALTQTEPLPAIARLEKLAQLNPGHRPTTAALADLYERAGRFEELALLWRELAAGEEDATQAALLRTKLGDLYFQRLRDPLRAKGQYERALARDRRCIGAWCGLSDVLVEQGETRAALLAMEEALSFATTDEARAKLHIKAGSIWEDALSDPESASLRYGEALSLRPGLPEALWRMAALHRTRRRFTRSAACYEELARHKELSSQERARAFFLLAQLLEDSMGDPEEAYACARRSLELDPNNQEARAMQERLLSYKSAPKPSPAAPPKKPSKEEPAKARGIAFEETRPRTAYPAPKAEEKPGPGPSPSVLLASPRAAHPDLETPRALPAQRKTTPEMPTPPQRPAVHPDKPTPKPPEPVQEVVEDLALEALADLAMLGVDSPAKPTPALKEVPRPAPPRELTKPPRLTSASELIQAAQGAKEEAAAFYRAVAAALDPSLPPAVYAPPRSAFAPPKDAFLAPRELFLGLAPYLGPLLGALHPEHEPGPVAIAEELFALAAETDAPRFVLRWVDSQEAQAFVGDPPTLELGAKLSQRPQAERRFIIARALASLRLSLPLIVQLSPSELEETLFLMAAACDPVAVVADAGALSEGIRAQAELLLEQSPEARREAMLPAVSVLLDAYGAIDFAAFQKGLLEETLREALCLSGDLTAALKVLSEEVSAPISQLLNEEGPVRRLVLFAAQACAAELSE